MRKIIAIIIIAITLVACNQEVQCDSDIEIVCTINNIEDFEIEENAQITIGVYEENFGSQITEVLNEYYPGVYSYVVIDESIPESLEELDIIQTKVENVPLLYDYLNPLDDQFDDLLENDYLLRFSKEVNQIDNYFMPFDVKGLLFAYNKTMLEELNVDLIDSNNDGLPDSIDSFEKIGEMAKKWKQDQITYLDDPLTRVFSFPFNDQLSMISFIENSEYRLIDGISGEEMNVSIDLANALEEFQKLGQYPWFLNDESMENMVWDYEEVLSNQSAPFMFVGNWMFYEQHQLSNAYELVFSKLPKINESEITTLSSISGFVLNKDSLYPNAQNQFIKFIKNSKGVETSINSTLIPIIDPQLLAQLETEIDSTIYEQIIAYTYSNPIQLHAFESNPSIRAYNVYLQVDFRDIWKDLFLNKIDATEAQLMMIERIEVWLEEYNLEVEGIENAKLEANNKQSEE